MSPTLSGDVASYPCLVWLQPVFHLDELYKNKRGKHKNEAKALSLRCVMLICILGSILQGDTHERLTRSSWTLSLTKMICRSTTVRLVKLCLAFEEPRTHAEVFFSRAVKILYAVPRWFFFGRSFQAHLRSQTAERSHLPLNGTLRVHWKGRR